MSTGQDAINAVRAKQGAHDKSFDANFDADQRQAVFNDVGKPRGDYVQGTTYFIGDETLDDGFLASCVVASTTDRPSPQDVGGILKSQPDDQIFNKITNSSTVYTVTDVEFTKPGRVSVIQAQVPVLTVTTNYKFKLIDVTNPSIPVERNIAEPLLIADGWADIAVGSVHVAVGTKWQIITDAWDSGTALEFNHTWNAGAVSNSAPAFESWNRNNQHNVLRYDNTDNTGELRTAELLSVTPNTTLTLSNASNPTQFFQYLVTKVSDLGTYVEYYVTLEAQGGNGVQFGDNTVTAFSIPQSQTTEYNVNIDYWTTNQPSFATMTGSLYFGSLDNTPEAGQENNAFGTRVMFTEVIISSDWWIKSSVERVSSGGGTLLAYADYGMLTTMSLTPTLTLIDQWGPGVPPLRISENAGVITVEETGIYKIDLERIYENDDNNPIDQVFVTIEIHKNDVSIFSRTAPISSATANDEPAILSFTTPALIGIVRGDEFKIYVSAVDNGVTPQDTKLIKMNVVANKIN